MPTLSASSFLAGFGTVRLATVLAALGLLGLALLPGGMAAQPAHAPALLAARRLVARQALGQLLFFEPALSGNGKRSCSSCHRPEKAFCDQRALPRALRFTQNLDRNSPSLLNVGEQTTFFHDGRARSLAAVLRAVLTSPREFGSSYAEATARLGSSPEYVRRFTDAFGSGAIIDSVRLAAALEAYLRTLTSRQAAYDRALRSGPPLDTAAQAGARLFAREAGCARCHGGTLFRDGQRYEVSPGQWVKTPSLRNVAATMPYGADGRYPTIAAVLAAPFHQAQQDRPLAAAEVRQLTAFLTALTDTAVAGRGRPVTLPAMSALPDRRIGGLY